jgi:uncharacterized membrane protein YfcA
MTIDAADILAVAGLISIGAGLYVIAGLPAVLIEFGSVLTVVGIWLARVRQKAKPQRREA